MKNDPQTPAPRARYVGLSVLRRAPIAIFDDVLGPWGRDPIVIIRRTDDGIMVDIKQSTTTVEVNR